MTNASLSFRIGKNYHTVRYLNNQSQPFKDTPFTESGLFLLGIGGFWPSSKSILSVIYYFILTLSIKLCLEILKKTINVCLQLILTIHTIFPIPGSAANGECQKFRRAKPGTEQVGVLPDISQKNDFFNDILW